MEGEPTAGKVEQEASEIKFRWDFKKKPKSILVEQTH
jgi:hypothetical protein